MLAQRRKNLFRNICFPCSSGPNNNAVMSKLMWSRISCIFFCLFITRFSKIYSTYIYSLYRQCFKKILRSNKIIECNFLKILVLTQLCHPHNSSEKHNNSKTRIARIWRKLSITADIFVFVNPVPLLLGYMFANRRLFQVS